jgi:hypothetical protein
VLAGGTSDSIVGKRYRVERAIGRGAMGEVLEVVDLTTGRRLALKRPRPVEPAPASLIPSTAASRRPRAAALNAEHLASLIRREYVILSQLAHPSVVAVYDCGIDDGKPFYTMELLRGEHPGGGTRLPWRDVCRLLTSLCEPLALLHSRRLVHRDISPRNVFVEPGGQAKLIDFGAMASMGAHHRPIGTPSCMAPEVWRREQLDGRADIFGLGALAYCALTGQHAYPSRSLAQLAIVWQTLPASASELVPDVPHGLGELLLSMLCLERDGRPQSVSEVMERLSALGDFGTTHWVAPPEALAAPLLVGREVQTDSIRAFVRRTNAGRGVVCVVRGEAGSGRTRLLEAVSQEAQEAGMRVAHVSAGLLEDLPFALARELVQALTLLDPSAAEPQLPPELDAALALLRSDEPIDASDEAERMAIQSAFAQFCEHKANERPLCLAIDDVERADVHSTRLLAQLVRRVSQQRLLVALVAGTDRPASGSPLAALFRQAVRLESPPLDAGCIEALARSVFGEVPNVARIARWTYRHSAGHLGTCFALFEYLVAAGVAKFVSSRWQLQEDIDALSPPSQTHENLELALHGREAGRALLDVLALVTRPFPLELSSYASALSGSEAGHALDDLVRAQLVLATGQGYVMRDYGALRWAQAQLTPERRRLLQQRLADLYGQHGDEFAIQVAHHSWEAGDRAQADSVVRRIHSSTDHGLRDLIWRAGGLNVPAKFLEELLEYRKTCGDSPGNLYAVRGALLAITLVSDVAMIRYAGETLDQISHDAGLDLWDQTDAELPNRDRALACVGLARARREAMPEAERGIAPEKAIVEIVRCIAMLSSPCGFTYDVALTEKLSTLIAPLRDLSADARIIADSVQLSYTSLVLGDRANPLRRMLIEASSPLAGQDVHPLVRDGIHHLNLYYLALDLASEGCDEAVQIAKLLEAHPLYEVLGLQVRRTHALGCGRYDEAQRWRRRRELQALRTERSDNHLHMALLRETQAAFRCWDLLELSRCLPLLEDFANKFPGWQPWASLTRSQFHARADEPEVARLVLEAALADLAPFSHGAWHALTAMLAEVQNELGDFAAARRLAMTVLEGAAGLGIEPDSLLQAKSALALAQAGLGDPKLGMETVQALVLEAQAAFGRESLRLGMLRETACHIAWLAKDYNAFSSHLDALGSHYAHHPGLRAQHARWVRKGKERFRKLLVVLEKANAAKDWTARLADGVLTQGGDDAGANLLAFVLDELQIESGQLYRMTASGKFQLLASRPDTEEPTLVAAAARSLENWLCSEELQTADEASESPTMVDSQGRSYVPLWLTKPSRADEVSGLVLANCSADQLAKLSPAFVKAVALHLDALA